MNKYLKFFSVISSSIQNRISIIILKNMLRSSKNGIIFSFVKKSKLIEFKNGRDYIQFFVNYLVFFIFFNIGNIVDNSFIQFFYKFKQMIIIHVVFLLLHFLSNIFPSLHKKVFFHIIIIICAKSLFKIALSQKLNFLEKL